MPFYTLKLRHPGCGQVIGSLTWFAEPRDPDEVIDLRCPYDSAPFRVAFRVYKPFAPPEPEHVGFIEEIRRHPGAEVHWQVYADWLEEQGDQRADFLRLHRDLKVGRTRPGESREQMEGQWREAARTLPPLWLQLVGAAAPPGPPPEPVRKPWWWGVG